MRNFVVVVFSFLVCISQIKAQETTFQKYMGLEPPEAKTAKIFAPGIISTKERWEEKISFSEDGKEIFFGRHPSGWPKDYFKPRLMHTKFENNVWTVPDTVYFSKNRLMGYPLLSMHGTVLFLEEPILPKPDYSVTGQILMSKKVKGIWSEPEIVQPKIQAKEGFGLGQMTNDSIFYFHDRDARIAYSSQLENGKFSKPKELHSRINPSVEIFVSPKNDYIIFMPLSWSNQFHIAFKDKTNEWGRPIPFRNYFPRTKTWQQNGCAPYVSPDGKYFFFSKGGNIWWVKADFIEELRKQALK